MNISNLPVKRYKHRSGYKVREERSGAERESEREVRFPPRINPGDQRVQTARRKRKTEGEKGKATGSCLMSSYESGPGWPALRD